MVDKLYKAKEFFTENDVIFISINNYEQVYLRVVIDNIFGEENFMSGIIWLNEIVQFNANNIKKNKKYIHVFHEVPSKLVFHLKISKENKKSYKDKRYEFVSSSTLVAFFAILIDESPNMRTKIYWKENDNSFVFMDDYDKKKATILNEYEKIYKVSNPKIIFNVDKVIEPSKNRLKVSEAIKLIDSKNIVVMMIFNYTKTLKLAQRLISSYYKKNIIILNVFANSRKTEQVVLQLNREDIRGEKLIICRNNENKIFYEEAYKCLYWIIPVKDTKEETYFKGSEKNKLLATIKLQVLNITTTDKTNMKNINWIIEKTEKDSELLSSECTKKDLDLHYDFDAFNLSKKGEINKWY